MQLALSLRTAQVFGALRGLPMKRPKRPGVSESEELSGCSLTPVSAVAAAADGDRLPSPNLSAVNGRRCSCRNWLELWAQHQRPELIRNNPHRSGYSRCTLRERMIPWIGAAAI